MYTYIYIFIYMYIYIHIYVIMKKLLVPVKQRVLNKPSKELNISVHKGFTTHRVLKSHRSKMSIIYMQWVLVEHSLFQWSAMCNRTSCAQVHELPESQSHCGDNREGILFSWLHICYTHFTSVYRESLMTTLIICIYI